MRKITSTLTPDSREFLALVQYLNSITDLPDSEISKLFPLLRYETYKKKELFLQRFEQPSRIAFVLSGLFRSCYKTMNGEILVKNFCRENSFLEPEITALKNNDSNVFIEALEKSEILSLSVADAVNLFHSHPCWKAIAMRILEEQYYHREKREFELLSLDAFSRYEAFLKSFPGVKNRTTQQNIASYLGITPVSLTRLLKRSDVG